MKLNEAEMIGMIILPVMAYRIPPRTPVDPGPPARGPERSTIPARAGFWDFLAPGLEGRGPGEPGGVGRPPHPPRRMIILSIPDSDVLFRIMVNVYEEKNVCGKSLFC